MPSPLSTKRGRAMALAGLALVLVAVHALWFRGQEDFADYVRAAGRFLAGADLYPEEDEPFGYKYSPGVALLFVPFTLVPFPVASAVWVLLMAACTVRALQLSLEHTEAPWWVPLVVFVLVVGPYKSLVGYGNAHALLVVLVLESEARARTRPGLSGVLLGLAVLFKFPLAVLIFLAGWRGQWKRVAAFSATVLVGLFTPVLWYGLSGTGKQLWAWKTHLERTTPRIVCTSENQGTFGLACLGLAPGDRLFIPVTLAVDLVVVATGARALWRLSRAAPARLPWVTFAAVLALSSLFAPLGWRSTQVALLPALTLLVAGADALGWPQRVVVLTAPTLAAAVHLVAFEVVGADGFQALMNARVFAVLGLVTAVSAVVVTARSSRAAG